MTIFQKDHPLLGHTPPPAKFMEEQPLFITAAGTGHPHQVAERSLEEQLPARNIIAHVPSFTAAAILAKTTDAGDHAWPGRVGACPRTRHAVGQASDPTAGIRDPPILAQA